MAEPFEMRTCVMCGKKFLPAPFHAYKVSPQSKYLMCTYSCMVKYFETHKRKTYTKVKT